MDGRGRIRGEFGINELSTLAVHAEVLPKQRPRRGSSEAHKHLRSHHSYLRFDPRPARLNLDASRFFVDPPFASFRRRPFKVFHHIGHIDFGTGDSGFLQCAIQQLAGRSNKWMPSAVFLVSWLLADQHDPCRRRAFSKNSLGGGLPKVAHLAPAAALRNAVIVRNVWGMLVANLGSAALS